MKLALKTLLRSNAVQFMLSGLARLYVRFVHLTTRWQVAGGAVPRALWEEGRPFILCFWHNRILMMPYCWEAGRPIHMLVSAHRDGQFIARAMAPFGISTVRGSTRRGGAQGLRQLIRLLRSGSCVGITPDGPRGPRMRAGAGIITLARLAGVPVVPVAFGVTRRRLANSWDRFVIALPFGRGVFVWGEPIVVARDSDDRMLAERRRHLEDALNALTTQADRMCGVEPIQPAPEMPAKAGA